jgi:DNA-directed RNA polymerase specialized sigma24 family protein
MKTAPSEQHKRETFFTSASRHLNRLYEFVRRQLAYFESVGDLMPGELTTEDVVDAVLLRAYHDYVKEPADQEVGSWLVERATEEIRREVKRLKSERNRSVHIEEDIPETPPAEEVSTLGEEILEFYQPDEDLRLEDIFPDADISTPGDGCGQRGAAALCERLAGRDAERMAPRLAPAPYRRD